MHLRYCMTITWFSTIVQECSLAPVLCMLTLGQCMQLTSLQIININISFLFGLALPLAMQAGATPSLGPRLSTLHTFMAICEYIL